MPTFNDWSAARETIDSLLACRPRPVEIVLVNDNHGTHMPRWVSYLPISIVNKPGNQGPAVARNLGAAFRGSRPIEWLYFTDDNCTRDAGFFAEMMEASAASERTTVAIAGPVIGMAGSARTHPINTYMTEEGILSPPRDLYGPQAIITANAAVCARAFRVVGGFCEAYSFAGGEDLDLGLRLRRLGPIGWASRAVVRHAFEECVLDFERRFERYGAGNALLARRLCLGELRCDRIDATRPELQSLADRQIAAMTRGYTAAMYRLPPATLENPDHPEQGRAEAGPSTAF